MDICTEIADFIDQEQLLNAHQKLVVAVSGGPDSLCLLHCLHRLDYQLIVAHLDHQLRPESESETRFVHQIASHFGLEFVTDKVDVTGFAERGVSIEEAARILRYRFLVRVAREQNLNVIATGHTADDQAETVLMHFLRGAGTSGLRGMLPKTSLADWVGIAEEDGHGLSLIRPLLCVTHQQAVDFCEDQGLTPIFDSSNLDLTFFRNRLRHHLLPILETYNPEIRNVLNRTSRVMAAEAAWLTDTIAECWPKMVRSRGECALALRVDDFLSLPTALQRAILREMIQKLKPKLRDVGFEAVERACQFVQAKIRGKRIYLVGDLVLTHYADEVLLFDAEGKLDFSEYPQLISESTRDIPIPGTVELSSGWTLDALAMKLTQDLRERIVKDQTGRIAAMDVSKIKNSLEIRTRKPGDRIRPLGMGGTLKVADLFINQHIPQLVRKKWPLVVSGDKVVWVVGLRISEDVRLTERTKDIVMLRLFDPTQKGGISSKSND